MQDELGTIEREIHVEASPEMVLASMEQTIWRSTIAFTNESGSSRTPSSSGC